MNGTLTVRLTLVMLLGLLAGSTAVVPEAGGAVSTEVDVVCMVCDSDENNHAFWPFECGDPELQGGGGDFECSRCGGESQCHANAKPGPCHLPCDMGGGGGGTLLTVSTELQTLHHELLAGQVSVVGARLVQLIRDESILHYNAARNAVQLSDCRGDIVAQWQLTPGATRLLLAE